MPESLHLFLYAILCLGGGALFALLPCRGRVGGLAHFFGAASAMAGSLMGLVAAGAALVSSGPLDFALPWGAGGVRFALHLDGLAAFFLLPLFLIAFCSALYAIRYVHPGPQRGRHWFFLNLLIIGMALVVAAANGLIFLFAWEIMSLASFFLVVSEFDSEEARRAGWLYLMATHMGAACLLIFFLEAGRHSGTLDFAGFGALRELPVVTVIPLFCLLLAGFGSKAGLFPMHVWLPDAHPAAPSHVSALMSGVMVKTAVYGFLRFLPYLPELPAWCGGMVILLGAAGAVFGIAMACLQTDIKRALAYSTVENIGLIFLGIGLWMAGTAGKLPAAGLALAGILFHIWNHALFKGLLFFSAGAMVHATGTRAISRMGGIAKSMPFTAFLFLLGAAAISALPPMNGLIGEWFLYLGLLRMGQDTAGGSAFVLMLLVALIGLAGGLVLLAFTRIAGIAILGDAATPEAERAHEVPWPMRIGMTVPALLCLVFGLVPHAALAGVAIPLRQLAGLSAAGAAELTGMLPLNMAWSVATGLLLFVAGSLVLLRYRQTPPATLSTWGCGYLWPNRRMAYRAGGFSQLARETLLATGRVTDATAAGVVTGLFPAPARHKGEAPPDPALVSWFTPFFLAVARQANRLHAFQTGLLPMYLASICIATVLLLGLAMLRL